MAACPPGEAGGWTLQRAGLLLILCRNMKHNGLKMALLLSGSLAFLLSALLSYPHAARIPNNSGRSTCQQLTIHESLDGRLLVPSVHAKCPPSYDRLLSNMLHILLEDPKGPFRWSGLPVALEPPPARNRVQGGEPVGAPTVRLRDSMLQ